MDRLGMFFIDPILKFMDNIFTNLIYLNDGLGYSIKLFSKFL